MNTKEFCMLLKTKSPSDLSEQEQSEVKKYISQLPIGGVDMIIEKLKERKDVLESGEKYFNAIKS